MARGRMVNKKISNSKRVNDMPLQTQLLFTWLIPHLDCNGCFYGSAQMVKSLVIPRKNWSKKMVEKCLTIMENSKNNEGVPLICRYSISSETYLYMPGFASEQTGLRYDKETPTFPTFDGNNTEMIRKKSARIEQEDEVEDKEEDKDSNSRCHSLLNVMKKYQENIAPRSELMDKEIKTAVEEYTAAWVIDAIKEAVMHNKLTWSYIQGILRNWKESGK